MTSEVPPATEVSTSDHAAIPSEAALRRAEAKPPLYRFFRGGLYVAYMIVAVWFCLSITVAVWRAVWGDSGRSLQVHEQVRYPLQATPAR
jgi:hypothetical protein